MSDTDRPPRTLEGSDVLDLAEASAAELARFAQRHHIAVEKLERCQQYLESAAPSRASFELRALEQASASSAAPTLVLRLRRDHCTWVELPRDFPSEHLLTLLELLHDS